MLDTGLTIGGAFLLTRFTEEEKIKYAKMYLNGNVGVKAAAKIVGVDHAVLLNWIRQYELHGDKAFKKNYTNYTLEYKLDVLKYMNEKGTSIRETAAIFNIPTHSTVSKWKNQLEEIGIDALKPKKKGRPSMKKKLNLKTNQIPVEGSVEALEARIKQLEMENEYLKKLNALVQNKEKSPSKTKHK